jgi:hypothetical protein
MCTIFLDDLISPKCKLPHSFAIALTMDRRAFAPQLAK